MNVLFISRDTLFSQPGGDTLQVEQTAHYLRELGHQVTIKLSGEKVNPAAYDLIHFFNLIRPADLKLNIPTNIPLVVSSIYHDYSEYDQHYRSSLSSALFSLFGKFGLEYIKIISRWINGSDRFPGWSYLLKGHKKSMQHILGQAAHVCTTSHQEAELIKNELGITFPYSKINLGSEHIEVRQSNTQREGILCAARIEGFKNQYNLIRAAKQKGYKLTLTGNVATNQQAYFEACKNEADSNTYFLGRISKEELEQQFATAKVHALISYYETTGLSTLEALKAGCQVVITDRGAQPEIFGNHAFYCDPNDVESIASAIDQAMAAKEIHSEWVKENFSWERAARDISDIYYQLIHSTKR